MPRIRQGIPVLVDEPGLLFAQDLLVRREPEAAGAVVDVVEPRLVVPARHAGRSPLGALGRVGAAVRRVAADVQVRDAHARHVQVVRDLPPLAVRELAGEDGVPLAPRERAAAAPLEALDDAAVRAAAAELAVDELEPRQRCAWVLPRW